MARWDKEGPRSGEDKQGEGRETGRTQEGDPGEHEGREDL